MTPASASDASASDTGASAASAPPVIELTDVEKSFVVRRRAGRIRRTKETVTAVAGLTFDVARGELLGYIGPNGAGKSTTIKMLTGVLMPTSGRLRVAGMEPMKERLALAQRIGVVFGQRTTLWWDLPLRDSFALLRRIYKVDEARHRRNLDELVTLLDLGPLLDVPVRQLSLGQRMRGDIVAALLHDPEILYLDEPTIGLDIISKTRVREFLAARNAESGTTILLTTHDLGDIERLCSRVMVIDRGSMVFDGTVAGLHRFGDAQRTLVVDLATPLPAIEIDGGRVVRIDGPRQWITFPATTPAAGLVAQVADRYPMVDLTVADPDIEAVVARLYERSAAG